jgi:hypothetical protein
VPPICRPSRAWISHCSPSTRCCEDVKIRTCDHDPRSTGPRFPLQRPREESMLAERMNVLSLQITTLFRRRQLERDSDDELQFHLTMHEQKLAHSGVPRRSALRRGARARQRDTCKRGKPQRVSRKRRVHVRGSALGSRCSGRNIAQRGPAVASKNGFCSVSSFSQVKPWSCPGANRGLTQSSWHTRIVP